MKGKSTFTQAEISELKKLIKERVKAERSRQKGIRAKMRRIGFYGSDDFGVFDMQLSDFEQLIKSGKITISDQNSVSITKSQKQNKKYTDNNSAIKSVNEFDLFDPKTDDSEKIPDCPGNYIVCLTEGAELPDIGESCTMKTLHGLNVIYTGIAGKSLRKRDYSQHFNGNNAGRSTLRKSLGSMFGYTKIARDSDPSTGKTKFTETDEVKLSEWMQSNLVLYFKINKEPNSLENSLISEFNPPLNLSKNSNIVNQQFRKRLSELRRKK